MHTLKASTSLYKVSKKLGHLNQQIRHVYIVRNKIKDIQSTIVTKKSKYSQIETIIHAHEDHLKSILDIHPEWKQEHTISPKYLDASTQPNHIAHSTIASLMNTYYEISRREQELYELNHQIQEQSSDYHYTIMEMEECHEQILNTVRECESEAKFFGIPFNFQRCYQAIHDTNTGQFSSI